MTWEYDEIVAGGQTDRYAMAETFAPYGTLINDPKLSKTGGKWTWATVPGQTAKEQSRTWVDGHFLAVPKYTRNQDWALAFIQMACSKDWMQRSMIRGNAPPRGSVLRDPAMVELIGWPPVAAAAIETGFPTPGATGLGHAAICRCAPGLSQAILGQKTPKQALDDVATDWQRGLRRAGVGKEDESAGTLLAAAAPRCRAPAIVRAAAEAGETGVRRRQRPVALVPGRGGRAGVRESHRHQGRLYPAADRRPQRPAEGAS